MLCSLGKVPCFRIIQNSGQGNYFVYVKPLCIHDDGSFEIYNDDDNGANCILLLPS